VKQLTARLGGRVGRLPGVEETPREGSVLQNRGFFRGDYILGMEIEAKKGDNVGLSDVGGGMKGKGGFTADWGLRTRTGGNAPIC